MSGSLNSVDNLASRAAELWTAPAANARFFLTDPAAQSPGVYPDGPAGMNSILTISVDELADRARELEAGESDYASFLACHEHQPAAFDAPLPLLRPGVWSLGLAELRRVALDPFPQSASRPVLWKGLVDFFSRLREFRIAKELWIGGSFLTQKEDPDDIDVAVVLHPGQFAEKVESAMRDAIEELLDQRVLLQRYGLDVGFFFNGDLIWTMYARGAFGFERDGTAARGFAVVPLMGEG